MRLTCSRGRITDVKRGGDVAVTESGGEQTEHFKFALGEITELRTVDRLDLRLAGGLFDQPFGDRRRQKCVAVGNDAQDCEEFMWRRVCPIPSSPA